MWTPVPPSGPKFEVLARQLDMQQASTVARIKAEGALIGIMSARSAALSGRLQLAWVSAAGRWQGCGYRLKAIERSISATTNTAVNARSIDSPPARTGCSTCRTGEITGSVPA
jgi:hypothetical protein